MAELESRGHEVITADLLNTDREHYIGRCEEFPLERIFENNKFDYVPSCCRIWKMERRGLLQNLWETNCIGTKHMIRLQEKKSSG